MGAHIDGYNKVYEGMGAVGKELPEVMAGFVAVHKACAKDGALPAVTRELIALAIAIAVRCAGCIDCHVNDSLKAGATPEQVKEVIGVAILMGGGPSVVYGNEALEALNEFTRELATV